MAAPEERGDLSLDRDGQFFWNGAPCIRREITDVFFAALEPDGAGGCRVRLGKETRPVRVAEAPLRVLSLLERAGTLHVLLDGDLVEPLALATLRYEGDVPWCRARGLDARFTPTAALALGREIAEGKIPLP
jgi:hypothetical protein